MIITKTPFRISFVGGGTDLKSFYSINGGQVCNTSIDKYLYVLVRKQIGFVEYKYRINWSKIEFKKSYLEDLRIRIDNGQSYFTVAIIALFKFIKNFRRFF